MSNQRLPKHNHRNAQATGHLTKVEEELNKLLKLVKPNSKLDLWETRLLHTDAYRLNARVQLVLATINELLNTRTSQSESSRFAGINNE